MTKLLVIDTSSEYLTVIVDHQDFRSTKQIEGARSHGLLLLATIQEALEHQQLEISELDVLAVVVGPGSFTGIRIGVGVAQGLAMALDIPIISISSLEWLACSAYKKHQWPNVMVCKRARETEVYYACYQLGQDERMRTIDEEKVAEAANVQLPSYGQQDIEYFAAGDGWLEKDAFSQQLLRKFTDMDADLSTDIDSLCELAKHKMVEKEWLSAELTLPSYLKENMNYSTVI